MADYPTSSNGEPKGPPQACLFCANLPLSPEVSDERIKDHFTQFGEVLKVKLIKDRSSRPYAFIQFSEVDDASEALKSNKLFEGKRLRVERAKVNRTLFIAKLNRNTTNSVLREQAQKFGPVESVTIIKNHQTNRSKGCGFVKYTYREDAMDAFVGLKNVNHKWVVEWATSTNDPDTLGVDKFNIFLGGLNPDEVTKEAIEAKFVEYGEIESVSLINKEEGGDVPEEPSESPGLRSAFAFVRYTDPSSSAAAIEAENGVEWLGRRIRVQYCESAEMKSKRRQTKSDVPPYAQAPTVGVGGPPPHQFYPSPPHPHGHSGPQQLEPSRNLSASVAPPMMMMPVYNMAGAPGVVGNKPPYGRGKVVEQVYPGLAAGYLNPALLAYTQPSWLFAQQQLQQQQQLSHALSPSLPLGSHLTPSHLLMSPPTSTHHQLQHPTHQQLQHTQQQHHTGRGLHPIQHHPQHSQHPQQHVQTPPQSHVHHNTTTQTQQQQQQSHSNVHHTTQQTHPTARPLQALQRNRDGSTSPNSDDSLGLDGDAVGGLTQSIAGWVLNK